MEDRRQLHELKTRLQAEAARVEVSFPYFLERKAPVTKAAALMDYECVFIGETNGRDTFTLGVTVPVTSLCPCSKAILEPHVGKFEWRCLRRRPGVELEIVRCRYEAWRRFAPHRYVTASLARSARCFAGLIDGRPAAFAGLMHFPHPKVRDIVSLSRLVVHPDFGGLGLGAHAFTETIGAI